MEAHGKFEVIKDGYIVHVYPSGGFNLEGVHEIKNKVLDVTFDDLKWVFIAHPKNEALGTPEAIKALIQVYNDYHLNGCVGVFVEASFMAARVIEKLIKPNTNILLEISDDPEFLLNRAKEIFKEYE